MQYFSELFSIHLIDASTMVVALCKKGIALDVNYSVICTLLKFRHLYQKLLFLWAYESTLKKLTHSYFTWKWKNQCKFTQQNSESNRNRICSFQHSLCSATQHCLTTLPQLFMRCSAFFIKLHALTGKWNKVMPQALNNVWVPRWQPWGAGWAAAPHRAQPCGTQLRPPPPAPANLHSDTALTRIKTHENSFPWTQF